MAENVGSMNSALANLDPALAQYAEGMEISIITDMFQRMTSACMKKCISPKYREPDLTKGESVCLDRCVAKFVDVHSRIGKKVADYTLQEQEALKSTTPPNPSSNQG
ncbi:translocase of inner membrane 10 [Brevipalpus obovatus]|uniref:translocase of inner membrane 10 n=1 Tax=Brevipalpus obovatus TaxID=246614 RepID=UPI003D9E26BF